MAEALIYIVAGIATAFNILIIKWKLENQGSVHAGIDAGLLALVFWLFSGSTALLVIGTIASAIISIYLLFRPLDESIFDDF